MFEEAYCGFVNEIWRTSKGFLLGISREHHTVSYSIHKNIAISNLIKMVKFTEKFHFYNISTTPSNIPYYYPYRAFGGQNKIVYSTRFVRRAIFFQYCPGNIFSILPGLYVPNHLTENRAMPRPP